MMADGSWFADRIVGELGEVILGKLPARSKEEETVVFESAGMAVWDSTAAAWAYRWAVTQQKGLPFSLEEFGSKQ
jgi:ornithine cyclodeaminase/alanine dehydrogenase-like protein (mu-crystallin family)